MQDNKMNPEVKAKWLEALRSGRYEQGRNYLKTMQGNYCCLGVLCDISGLGSWSTDGDGENVYDGAITSPSRRVYDWAGEAVDRASSTLMNMNDGAIGHGVESHSFSEIADWIEENL